MLSFLQCKGNIQLIVCLYALKETTMRDTPGMAGCRGHDFSLKHFRFPSVDHSGRRITMKKLQMNDLTPELLQEVMKLSDPKDIVAFFQSKDFEVSEEGAQKILDTLKDQVLELDVDDLENVAGGGCGGGNNSNPSSVS